MRSITWAIGGWTVLLLGLSVVLVSPALVCPAPPPGSNMALCGVEQPDALWAAKGLSLLLVWALGLVVGIWWRRRSAGSATRSPEVTAE